jgi:hypothetical protein
MQPIRIAVCLSALRKKEKGGSEETGFRLVPLGRKRAEGLPTLPAGADQSLGSKQCEMTRDRRLAGLQDFAKLGDRKFLCSQESEDPQPREIPQHRPETAKAIAAMDRQAGGVLMHQRMFIN